MTLRATDLRVAYGRSEVLRGVTITVPDGSVVALLGPNGAGKTTLLRALSGMIPLQAGQIGLDALALVGRASYEFSLAGIGHIPEGRSIFPRMTVNENLLLFSTRGQEADCLERAITLFPMLGERRNQIAGTLSGGEQQMLALARCEITRPKVILVDEVSLGLAPKIVDDIFASLRAIAERGTALLVVEQYITKALGLADYAYILNRGRIQFAGEPSELNAAQVYNDYVGATIA
jgi:branched-chain amino acid transport system ATP-binding protein